MYSFGKTVLVSKYEDTYDFCEGLAAVKYYDGKFGYIDKSGNEVIPCKFNNAHDFKEGYAPVNIGLNKWIFIDKSGKQVIDKEYYKIIHLFNGGVATVQLDENTFAYIDKDGKIIHKDTNCIFNQFNNGNGLIFYKDLNSYRYADYKGNLSPKFREASRFHDNLAVVLTINGEYKVINEKHRIIDDLPKNITNPNYIGNGIITYGKPFDLKEYFMNIITKEKIDFPFYYMKTFSEDISIGYIKNDGGFGFIKKGSNEVKLLPNIYDAIFPFSDGLAIVENKHGLYGYIDTFGKEVIPCNYKRAGYFSSGLALITDKNNNSYYINKKGKKALKIESKYVTSFDTGEEIINISAPTKEELNEKKLELLKQIKSNIIKEIESVEIEVQQDIYESTKKKVK